MTYFVQNGQLAHHRHHLQLPNQQAPCRPGRHLRDRSATWPPCPSSAMWLARSPCPIEPRPARRTLRSLVLPWRTTLFACFYHKRSNQSKPLTTTSLVPSPMSDRKNWIILSLLGVTAKWRTTPRAPFLLNNRNISKTTIVVLLL